MAGNLCAQDAAWVSNNALAPQNRTKNARTAAAHASREFGDPSGCRLARLIMSLRHRVRYLGGANGKCG